MSKICGKCDKPVYPTEELKCMDKSWHKLCFKCWECNTTLNVKNYKAFDKKPYCSAHCPQQKPTSVADTPELSRLAKASSLQSQANYTGLREKVSDMEAKRSNLNQSEILCKPDVSDERRANNNNNTQAQRSVIHADSSVLTDNTRLRYAVTPPSTDINSARTRAGCLQPDNPVRHTGGS